MDKMPKEVKEMDELLKKVFPLENSRVLSKKDIEKMSKAEIKKHVDEVLSTDKE